MSLLMDALRKAEDAKRQSEASTGRSMPGAPELTLEPLNTRQPPQASRLPDLAEHSAALDAGLSAIAREAPAVAGTATPANQAAAGNGEAAARAAARNVFAAKLAAPARRTVWPLIIAAGTAAALAIGAYFWWQLQALSGNARPHPAPPTAPATPPAATLASTPTASLNSAAPLSSNASLPTEPSSPAPPPTAEPRRAAASTRAVTAPSASVAARQRAPRADDLPVHSVDGTLRLSKTPPPAQRAVEDAFDALQAGRLDDAQRAYEQVLRSDAHNTDAWLGLATIATRQGRSDRAQGYYLRALEADPNNATAQAGLLNGRAQSDASSSESRLKGALDAQPESSALLFALGNLYARQARWSEAQQAYFRAYAAEPDNADILFNLAVALDHLRQAKLAAQYYQMALDAARMAGNSVLFDRNQARNRIQELQP